MLGEIKWQSEKMTTEYPYSIHAFMFPIRWDVLPKGYNPDQGKESIEFDSRTDLRILAGRLKNTAWRRSFYRINNDPLQYNELTYFHAYASKSIIDLQQKDEGNEWVLNREKTMAYFDIEISENDYYQIETIGDGIFKLKLTGLSLHTYNTGVAILTINLENYNYPDPEQILCINEFGRRIYPMFLGKDPPFTELTKVSGLASTIELKCGRINNGIPLREDFREYDSLFEKETHKVDVVTNRYNYNCIINFPSHIKGLFSDDFAFNANDEHIGDTIRLNILTDDRMFFQCWYGNNELAKKLSKENCEPKQQNGFAYLYSDFWYAFMYGDQNEKSLGIANRYMEEKDMLNNTYARWANFGTLYGFTRDSFVTLSDNKQTLIDKKVPDIQQHCKTIYYQMAVLCLAQRASVLRFSAEVSSITQLGKTHEKIALQRIQQLYLNYIEFINTLCFREITPQIQGIEIYKQFRKAMNVPKDVKSLDNQIEELHSFAMFAEQKRAADKSAWLNKIATYFLPGSVIIGLMGINVLSKDNMHFGERPILQVWEWIISAITLSVITTIILLMLEKRFQTKRSKTK